MALGWWGPGAPPVAHCPLTAQRERKGEEEGKRGNTPVLRTFFWSTHISYYRSYREENTKVLKNSIWISLIYLWIWFSLGAVLWSTLSDTCIPGTHHCHTNKYLKKYQHPPLPPYHKIEEMKSIFYPSPRLSKLYFPFGYHFNGAKAGDNDFTQDIWNSNHFQRPGIFFTTFFHF